MSPACRHFGTCGGCSLQHLAPEDYLDKKREIVRAELARQGVPQPASIEMLSVPPRSRRRATLKLQNVSGKVCIGFHAPRSHALIDIEECHVLTPGLFRVAQALRDLLRSAFGAGRSASVYLLEADNGFDLSFTGLGAGPERLAGAAASASDLHLLRITADGQLLYASGTPEVTFGEARVALPPDAFLQPTREGERILQDLVAQTVGKTKKLLDLFSGCGTFSLFLAKRTQVHAVDRGRAMLQAADAAARRTRGLKPLTVQPRDLFKLPLTAAELNRFDAVSLDPPRAGAMAQVKQLARSAVPRIAYVSCDAASFARDARVLLDGGYRMDRVVGVDQFLWSAHVELVAAFSRPA